ncbi:NADPH:quinone reductase [Klenkia soli]|uniref:NADPH:quinone reductase n=1 Tax=Klenkia soli TaxID=1052260 RepID=A0A1H0L634_9ACTN|nr:NADP-dependent oxidoreductase [Klenkia soli]SDO63420.1 NADPH:quinone reductase [Klenkia soli]
MRAVTYTEFGGPEVLAVSDLPEPHAGPGQVRIAVHAAGLNPVDWKIFGGMMGGELSGPRVPGIDAAGVVDEVGEGVPGVQIGDEVFGFAVAGSLAEFAVLGTWAPRPASSPWEVAGGLVVTGETAVRTLDLIRVGSGDALLVDGAAGGVGLVAVQLGVHRGAQVIGTCGAANEDFVRSLGAIPTAYGAGLVERVREIAPDGVDAALDTAGKGSVADLIELTGDPGRVVTIADFGASELGAHVSTGGGERGPALRQVGELLAQGTLTTPVAGTFTLEQAADAYRESQAGHVRGKLVVLPRG